MATHRQCPGRDARGRFRGTQRNGAVPELGPANPTPGRDQAAPVRPGHEPDLTHADGGILRPRQYLFLRAAGNGLARHGRSKKKRNDCLLMTLEQGYCYVAVSRHQHREFEFDGEELESNGEVVPQARRAARNRWHGVPRGPPRSFDANQTE